MNTHGEVRFITAGTPEFHEHTQRSAFHQICVCVLDLYIQKLYGSSRDMVHLSDRNTYCVHIVLPRFKTPQIQQWRMQQTKHQEI